MTIKIILEAKGKNVFYSQEEKEITLLEAALINLKLDRAKDFIKSLKFKSEFEVKEGYREDDD